MDEVIHCQLRLSGSNPTPLVTVLAIAKIVYKYC